MNAKKLQGRVFGELTVREYAGTNRHNQAVWLCDCSCGNVKTIAAQSLLNEVSRSCGAAIHRAGFSATHGLSKTLEYGVWSTMKQRCSNPNVASYKDYGGRGVKVCKRWSESFEAFLEDMGRRPSPQHSIERKNNEGDYTPRNCFWATRKVQVKNRRNNRMLTANGETLHMAEWARRLGCNPAAILARLATGMSEEEAVTKPVPSRPNSKLTEDDARYIKKTYPSISMEGLAAKLGVSKKTVFNVLHGKVFTDV